jgi:uncharacterized membrane protein (DUF4010 family)
VDWLFLQQLAVSFGLGFLLGLERQRTEHSIAGIRTLPLVCLFGTVCAAIARDFGGWIFGAGLLGLAGIVIIANHAKLRRGRIDPGMTTEIAVLLLYMVGGLVVLAGTAIALVLAGVMALVLHYKDPLHRFAAAIGARDMRAIMHFVLLSLVILPVLPRGDYGPWGVWNPFKIWLMVVLIVGISLAGYVAYKLLGARAGTLVGGVIGGLISSTAATVSFARRSASQPELASLAALVIQIASCISLARVLVEIAVVAPGAFAVMAPPLAALLGLGILVAGLLYALCRREKLEMPEQKNPAELGSALLFGGLYALVLLAVAAGKTFFGSTGLYAVGVISGLTDMDAITLSTAQLAGAGSVEGATAWRVVLAASLSNFIFKFATVAALGAFGLTLRVGGAFAALCLGGGLILWLWPG